MSGALVWRYWTAPDCVRHWFLVANTHAPEIVRAAFACSRAGALALPMLPALPMVPGLLAPAPAAIVQPYPALYGAPPDLASGPSQFARGGFASPAGAVPLPQLSARERGEQMALAPQMTAAAAHAPSAAGGYPAPHADTALAPQQAGVPVTAPRQQVGESPMDIPDVPSGMTIPDAPVPAPEPGTLAMLGVWVLAVGLAGMGRRR